MPFETTSGKLFTALIGTTPIGGTFEGDVNEEGGELDGTDNTTGVYTVTDVGPTGLKGTLTGNHRVSASPWPGFQVGTILTNLKIYPHGSASPGWIMPEAIVLQGSTAVRKRDKVTFRINFASRGTYSWGA